jgi:Domain of unknown function (DUF4173)
VRPEPNRATATFAAAAVACGLLAALLLPGERAGLGFALVAVSLAVTVAVPAPGGPDAFRVALGVLAVALAAMAVLRTAGWLVALDAVAAVSLGSVALAPPRTWAGMRRGLLSVYARLPTAPFFLAWSTGIRLGPTASRGAAPALRGLAIAAPLVWLFGTLFASADAAFANLADGVLNPDLDLGPVVERLLVFGLVASLAGALVLVALKGPVDRSARKREPRNASDWLLALSLVVALFAGFVAVQLTVLFGGHDHVLETEGLTYSEYAREGFGELVVTAVLTLALVAAAVRFARPETSRQRWLLKLLLGALCGLTLVILASALKRLDLYEEAFGFTRLRLMGQAISLWLGATFVLVIAAGAVNGSSWLPRAVTVLTGASLLVLSLLNPDGLIASENVDRYGDTGRLDRGYVSGLSADATPALAELPGPIASCVLGGVRSTLEDPDSFSELNVGRARARHALEDVPTTSAACP